MKFLILLLFFFCTSLSAHYTAVTEGEPSSLIEGIVSVITGDLYLSEEDILIEGAEPLRLKRNYIGIGRQHVIFPHMFAVFNYDLLNRVICEKKQAINGTLLFLEEYSYDAAGNQSAIVRFPNDQRAEETSLYDPFNRLIEKKRYIKLYNENDL
jgi:hypothetical protein